MYINAHVFCFVRGLVIVEDAAFIDTVQHRQMNCNRLVFIPEGTAYRIRNGANADGERSNYTRRSSSSRNQKQRWVDGGGAFITAGIITADGSAITRVDGGDSYNDDPTRYIKQHMGLYAEGMRGGACNVGNIQQSRETEGARVNKEKVRVNNLRGVY